MCNKTKNNNNKKHFCRYCLQYFGSEKVLQKHKEVFLIINGIQSIKLRSCSIKFKNHFKQLVVPFKIYADFECNVKEVKSNNKKNNGLFLSVLPTKLFVLMIDLAKNLFFTE